jgi:hypothetical protein
MNDWKPIESAPINENVLLYCPDRGITNKSRIEFCFAKRGRFLPNGDIAPGTYSEHAWATHWMPAPGFPD